MPCFSEFVFEISQDGLSSARYHNIVHLQQAVSCHVSKTGFCRYYLVRGLPYGGSPVCWGSSMAGLHWSEAQQYFNAGNGGKFIWQGSLMWKLVGTVQRLINSLSTAGVVSMGVSACPIDTNPFARLRKHFRTDMRKLRRGCRNPNTRVIMLFRPGAVSLENCCTKLLALKMNFARTPMWRIFQWIFEMSCTRVEAKVANHITVSKKERRSTMWTLYFVHVYL